MHEPSIRMFAVDQSSNVVAFGYLAEQGSGRDAGTLRVQFKGGGTYDYDGVGLDVLSAFLNAPSMGGYVARSLRGHFQSRRIDEPARVTSPEHPVAIVHRGEPEGRTPAGGCR